MSQLTIEFSHAPLTESATEDQLLDAMLAFEDEVLIPRPAFSLHAVLRNAAGRYAHLVVADDPVAFGQVMEDAPGLESLPALMACLDHEKMTMFMHRPLGQLTVPERFAVVEHGTFRPKDADSFEETELEARALDVRSSYLDGSPGYLAQCVTAAGEGRCGELVFGSSLAHTRRTCRGYLEDPVCRRLLALADPEHVDLDFWLPLLVRPVGS